MNVFDELGQSVEQEWSRAGFEIGRFPDIAAAELDSANLSSRVDYEDVIRWIAGSEKLPQQVGRLTFAQPPVTLYWNSRFHVDVLFWTTATTAIHEHPFSGAFAVLAGSSLQSTYEFVPRDRVTAESVLGDIRLATASLLRRGDIQPIRSGSGLIHSVFHLDTPSVTVVVRTLRDADAGPGRQYLRPHLALEDSAPDGLLTRRLQLLDLLVRIRSPRYEETALAMLDHSPLLETFHILNRCRARCSSEDALYSRLIERAYSRHGGRVALLLDVIEERRREAFLIARRARVTDPDHRLFLALLLNLPDRDSILRMVRDIHGTPDPERQVVQWVIELGDELFGAEPTPFDIAVFRHLLAGLSPRDVSARLRDERVDPFREVASASDVEDRCATMLGLRAFATLLRTATPAIARVRPIGTEALR